MLDFLYHYKMTVTKVVDGDTVYGDVDLGFNIGFKKMEFRLSEKFVEDTIAGKEVIIVTKKDGKEKYGRYLAEVFFLVGAEWVSLNKTLLDKGLAVEFMV